MNQIAARTRADFARQIGGMWGQARDSMIETGKLLLEAKKALKHGEFGTMCHSDLPFSDSMARKLMAVARNPNIVNREHAHDLPASWDTLYHLSRLKDDVFAAALARGDIKPDMERKDAERLVSAERRTEKLQNIEAKAAANVDSRRTLDEVVKHVATKNRRYAVIYFDPPWKTYTHSDKGLEKSADLNHYPTMTDEEIAALPIDDLAHQDAVLFLWSTANRVELTVDLVRKWGFKITTFHVWDKVIAGTGHWGRDRFEPLYICTRGNIPAPLKGVDDIVESLYAEAKKGHSEKPRRFRDVIGDYFPSVTKIELFARKETIAAQYPDGALPDGWDFWGNEMPLSRADGGELVDLGTGELTSASDYSAEGVPGEGDGGVTTAPSPVLPHDPRREVALPCIDDEACATCLRWAFMHRSAGDYPGHCGWHARYSEARAVCGDFVPASRDARRETLAKIETEPDSGHPPPDDLLRAAAGQSVLASPTADEQLSGAIDPDVPIEPDDDPFKIPAFLRRDKDNNLPGFLAAEAENR